jgi:hypothetical protein
MKNKKNKKNTPMSEDESYFVPVLSIFVKLDKWE